MATAKEIEEEGYRVVVEHEKRFGRTATRAKGEHFDMRSSGNGETRHIEVKASTHACPAWHVLQPKVFQALRRDKKLYVYLVCGALGSSPTVYELTAAEFFSRFAGIDYTYRFSFGDKYFRQRNASQQVAAGGVVMRTRDTERDP